MVKQEISEYERKRQENIAERDALLKKLSLEAAGAGVGTKRTPKRESGGAPKKKAPAVKRERDAPVATRKSSRLQGFEADSAVVKRKAEEQLEQQREQERIKRMRVTKDMDLKDVVVGGAGAAFNWDLGGRGAQPYVRTFDPDEEVKQTTDKELKALRERMSNLELYEGYEPGRIKITPERIYAMQFHPSPDKALCFAGDKMGNMGIFDATQEVPAYDEDDEDAEMPDPVVNSFHVHTRTITSIQFSPSDTNHCITSSYDSSIRLLDLASSTSRELYGPEDALEDEPLSGLDIDPTSPHVIYFSRLDGHIGRIDTRTKASADIWSLSDKKIGGFSLHPALPHFFATASLDRTMALWDVRKMVKVEGGSKRPHCVGVHESRLSVSHAAFNSTGQVATASYDDTVKVYDFEDMKGWKIGKEASENELSPRTTIKHNNQTGRWVTILKAQWQRAPEDGVQRFVIGNMNRFVDIYTGQGEQLAQLGGDGITAVPAVAVFHPTQDWISAGTASGKLCLWR